MPAWTAAIPAITLAFDCEKPAPRWILRCADASTGTLHTGHGSDPIVRSAMAHLNLVMIHPFRDGNGRMARALATLVLSRSDIGEPEFSSIEEWLGANTEDYYSVLAHTGHGSWKPRGDAHLWLAFILRAHHMQAQTLARRVAEAGQTWVELEALTAGHGLHERTLDAMYDAGDGREGASQLPRHLSALIGSLHGPPPALPTDRLAAIGRLGFGRFEKVALRFAEPFWREAGFPHLMVFPREPEEWMVWVMGQDAFGGGSVLVFFVFHSAAERLAGAGADASVRWALGMLAEAIGRPCPEPTAVAVSSWAADPWTGGAYTHIPPGASPADADLLGEPVGGRLLFAGEHTQSARLAYGDGALTSGIREAKRLLGTPAVRITVNHAPNGD